MTNATETRNSRNEGQLTAIRTTRVLEQALEHACRVARTCEEYRGQETVVLDVTQVTPLFDYFVITTGRNRRQLHALADHADDAMAEVGSARLSTSGYETEWVCQDYGDVVLHVFSPNARAQYDLEALWGDAPRVDWRETVGRAESAES